VCSITLRRGALGVPLASAASCPVVASPQISTPGREPSREQWGKLTDDDIEVIAGKRDQLVGRLQERYGLAKEDAEKEANAFVDGLNEQEKDAAKIPWQK
jgi:uncharacterized protein YjbJ (UPF0337 family)